MTVPKLFFSFSVTKVKNPVVPIAQVYLVDAPVRVLFWIISCAAPESCDSGAPSCRAVASLRLVRAAVEEIAPSLSPVFTYPAAPAVVQCGAFRTLH
jgi:hypothetical protein